MPAPTRLLLRIGTVKVSAFVLPEVTQGENFNLVCKECAPKRTKMRFIVQVGVPTPKGELNYYVYQCGDCARQWALPTRSVLEQAVST